MRVEVGEGFVPSARQLEAIEAPLGPVLVLAGPGSGKTLCLIERIRFLIERHGFAPTRICAVTFTNKAAEEIGDRLKGLGHRAQGVKRGTLHALCAEILRDHGEWVGVRRGFGIADEDYQRGVLRRLGVWERRRGPLLVSFGRQRAGQAALSPGDLAILHRYRDYLEQRNLLDFDDLVVQTAELLERYEEIAGLVAGRWDYLLVDEFQDLNPRQYAVVRLLAERHRNLFAVGDDEQSVYSWAGADPRVLRDFLNDFRLDRKLVLDENWRTARQIFGAARRLLQHNPPLFEEKLLRAERGSEHPVRVLGFGDDASEARWLLEDLVADQRSSGLPWGEYGVLYRTHEVGETLEAALLGGGLPCRLAAGRALADDPVVRYLIAALRVIAAPGDSLRQEEFVRVVLPSLLWARIVSEAEHRKAEPLAWMGIVAKRLGKADEDAKKIRRADSALQNLPALASRHESLAGLIEELLSHRVGEYRTALEDRHEELSDPVAHPVVVKLAGRLEGALHGRRRVVLPRLGGLEIALSGMLMRAGLTAYRYGEPGTASTVSPRPSTRPEVPVNGEPEIVIGPEDGGPCGLALGLFKALQLIHTGTLRDTFRDFVTVDVETSDFDRAKCEIIELGAVRVRNGEAVAEYQQLIQPRGPIAEAARQVHGITPEEVQNQPMLEEAWSAFRGFCGDDILVAHNGNGFDFPILRRAEQECGPAAGQQSGRDMVTYDSLPLARDLHPGSRRLGDLAHALGIEPGQAHRALGDARTLALVFPRLQAEKVARARKTALAYLLDYLGLALVLSDPDTLPPEADELLEVAKAFALGRYSDCLDHYRLERTAPPSPPEASGAPSLEEVIERLGGQRKLVQYRREKRADERYPAAMARLRRLLGGGMTPGESLGDQLRAFLDRIALSRSDAAEPDADLPNRVNLLTLHSTKGLEFSRVYIVGVEDGQLIRIDRDGHGPADSDLQESRRLLYVGMTRAKDRLVLTRVERRRGFPTGGYRFLSEMGFKPQPPD